jgi:transcriptional regulator with XRE-family HTH domain
MSGHFHRHRARHYITLVESGQRRNPSLPAIKALAKALGVGVADLME